MTTRDSHLLLSHLSHVTLRSRPVDRHPMDTLVELEDMRAVVGNAIEDMHPVVGNAVETLRSGANEAGNTPHDSR